MKKWDWLRAGTAKTLEDRWSRRCLSQFFHSLGAHGILLRFWPWFDPRSGYLVTACECDGRHGRLRICKMGFDSSAGY
jgi:hypothetical protein